jgi:hypothetical protein
LQHLVVYAPVLIAVLILLPRLLSPQFGLFDDGKSIVTALQISHGNWSFQFDQGDGRFRPIYWLSFALVYLVFGLRPFWFFLVNALILAITTYCLIRFLLNLGRGHWQAGLTGLAFVLAGPVIENYYTLSKGEPWQVLFLALSLLAFSHRRRSSWWWTRIGWVSLMAALMLLADFSKETSLVIAPIALVWYLGDRWLQHSRKGSAPRLDYGEYLLAGVISALLYVLLRMAAVPAGLHTEGYTNNYVFTLAQVQASLLRWSGWLMRDFAYLAPLVLGAAIVGAAGKKLPQAMLMFQALVWVAGWVAVFLPWYYMAEYYMLPAAIGLAVFVGALLEVMAGAWRSPAKWLMGVGGLFLAAAVLLFLLILPGTLTSARIQLAVDASNDQALRTIARSAPQDSTVLVNIQVANEYVEEIQYLLPTYYHRPDLVVETFHSQQLGSSGTYYVLSPQVTHQPLLTVRMGVVEATQDAWDAGLQAYLAAHPGWQKIATIQHHFRMSVLDLPRLLCRLIKTRAFCATPSPLVDTRPFTYGWTIYQQVLP